MYKYVVKLFMLICIVIAINGTIRPVAAYEFSKMPNVHNEMLRADYWIKQLPNPDKIIMSVEEIDNFNQDIQRDVPGSVLDLKTYSESLSRAQLCQLLDRSFPDEPSYIGDQAVEPGFWTELQKQISLDSIEETNQVKYGFTVRRSNLKTFPTDNIIGDEPGDPGFDLFQDSSVLAAEPLLILHHSADQQWYFVQIYNYAGWLPVADVAISDRETWLEYQEEKEFLVVTANHLKLDANPLAPEISELEFSMGCKLPLVGATESSVALDMRVAHGNYLIKIPTRNAVGQLVFKIAALPISNEVAEGYLPYTRANIIRQAFKMQGDRYCWGGMLNGRDCSSLVMELYRCFGFRLARNTDAQEISTGKTISFNNHDRVERATLMNQIMPGAVLYFSGHEMLYVGEEGGRYYVINALGGYDRYKTGDGELETVRVRSVVVNDLSLMRYNGNQWLDELTTAKQLEKP
ncbi:SH3 domain-containing protein [Desulfosporosinus sp. Sb-LF]|uniref:SH3 domain-containing protein n=1 Tax=Desulfosporosinus sp. Sb-LF TaxID=2560027 RepID=UPI00107FCAAB|nr:SH3 domain-containing protein [Desulfosporosinus sp. Sb-LF]TGE33868.1 hypothetical protein E4K68_03350 [Desulfosporosinus sp. Sb-LF]